MLWSKYILKNHERKTTNLTVGQQRDGETQECRPQDVIAKEAWMVKVLNPKILMEG